MRKVVLLIALACMTGAATAGVFDELAQFHQFYIKQSGLDKLTIVMPPGHKVIVDGKSKVVAGQSICPVVALPDSKYIFLVDVSGNSYAQEYAGRPGCIVVGPQTSTVSVVLYNKTDGRTNRQAEDWTVHHGVVQHADSTVMKRPNGEFVADAK